MALKFRPGNGFSYTYTHIFYIFMHRLKKKLTGQTSFECLNGEVWAYLLTVKRLDLMIKYLFLFSNITSEDGSRRQRERERDEC